MTILSSDYPRISSDYRRIVFLLAEAFQAVSAAILDSEFRAGAVLGESEG